MKNFKAFQLNVAKLLPIVFFILVSCLTGVDENEVVNGDKGLNSPVSTSVDFIDPSVVRTDAEKDLSEKIVQVTKILRKIYKDPKVRKEINAAVVAKLYKDERISLRDMLNLESSLFKNEKFKEKIKQQGIEPGGFSEAFTNEARSTILGKDNSEKRVNELYFVDAGIYIYFPYSEDTQSSSYPITVVSGTVDSNSAYATHPLCDDATPATYAYCSQTVLVDDNYAATYPTHIVVAGGEPQASYQTGVGQNLLVKLGYIRCKVQYDNLISFKQNGGGSEIMFGRIDGYQAYSNNGTVISWAGDIMRLDISRRQIRNQTWVSYQSNWDQNWETDNPQQVLGIYEEDNTKSTVTFNGSFTTKYGNSTVGPIGFTITGKSKDAIIRMQTMDRLYFTTNGAYGMDFGQGKVDNWPIWDGRLSVSYTLPFQYW